MKKTTTIVLLLLAVASLSAQSKKPVYLDSTKPIELRVKNVLSLMTLKEKVGQLNLETFVNENDTKNDLSDKIKKGDVGSILKSNGVKNNLRLQKVAVEQTRLGIPLMFEEDVIHGYRTIFPSPLGESASWNLDNIEKSASIAAKEASASGIHLTYAPMVDISYDPRWGRILEGAGEDPYYASFVAAARVKGFQGTNLASGQNVMACVKHFAGYGAALAGRDYNIADFSERTLREIYLPPFRAAINAGVGSVMTAYSAYDGVPATANKKLLIDILRRELGFDKMLITDWATINNLVKIGIASDEKEAVLMAINSGVDVDMTSGLYLKHLEALIAEGKINIKSIDKAVERVLIAKFKLGLFDDPYKFFNEQREKETLLSPDHLEFARKSARECMVLLKNDNKILPLNKSIKKIAVIGPLANRQKDLLSWWGGNYSQGKPDEVISVLEGLKKSVNSYVEINYAEGVKLDGFDPKGLELIPEAVKLASESDLVILVVGEEYWMSGEGGSISNINLPGIQDELVNAIANTGKPIVSVLVNGRPFDIQNLTNKSMAVLEAWQPGTMGGLGVADILLGKYNPSGKLTVSFPINTGQIPIYYNYKRTSHDATGEALKNRWVNKYLDIPTTPLFPFGYGLSYTTFVYSNLILSKQIITEKDELVIDVDVTNTGKIFGEEVVQLYIGDIVSSVSRPLKELKGFRKIGLDPNEKKVVSFIVKKDDLSFYNQNMKWVAEPGKFNIMVGASSEDIRLNGSVELK
ncbi:MAG: beta-glucosidase BglX [Paludibacter sp.]|nr:beta-glucosidase BglX [Paludibacter sp.]